MSEYPDAGALVTAALKVMQEKQVFIGSIMRTLPQLQAILTAPDGLRRACILNAAAAGADGWPRTDLLAIIARRRAGLSLEDIEAVLAAPLRALDQKQAHWVHPRMDALMGQVEATWTALGPQGRDRLRGQLARIAAGTDSASPATANRLRSIAGIGRDVPYDLIPANDFVCRALRAVLTASTEGPAAKTAVIELITSFPWNGKPARAWLSSAAAARDALADPVTMAASMVDAVTDPYSAEGIGGRDAVHDGVGAENGYLHWNNQAIAGAVPVFAGQAAAAEGGAALLPRLRRLALKSIAGPRSIKLANASVKAIADAGLPASVTELQRVERGTRHGTLLKQARTGIGKLAAAQGLGRDELLERAVEDHGLSPGGTRAIPLADGWTAILAAASRGADITYRETRTGRRASRCRPPSRRRPARP